MAIAGSNDTSNFTKAQQLKKQKIIQEGAIEFALEPQKGFSMSSGSAASAPTESILVGYPLELIGESHMFGGVITKVSERESVPLGNLKMSSLTAAVKTEIVHTTQKNVFVLRGNIGMGRETQESQVLVEIPIVKTENNKAYLDLSALGEKLDISYQMGDFGDLGVGEFKHLVSKTTAVDFSLKTLVFDVESTYNIIVKDQNPKTVVITTRWFLRLNSMANPFFERRKNTEGVGYFVVDSSKDSWIARFPIQDLKNNPVKYYLKNFPIDVRRPVVAAFEDWNHKLQNTLGHDLLSYEIIEKNDPRYDQIVAGDVRYNVLEWDIDNMASYGGLGPTLKNILSGEVLSGQVLIQGPTILSLYKKWFKVQEQVTQLRANNQFEFAEILKKQLMGEMFAKVNRQNQQESVKATVGFGSLNFDIPAQNPNLQDALSVDPLDYLLIPAGYSYESYMNGYWREIIAHEMGHNLGLRHNFKGNLKDKGEGTVSSVSRSVMEYLPRTHRHLNRVSEYDVMAIAYGYLGVMPEHTDWFCTDGDQGSYSYLKSAECSNSDATQDPVSFFEVRINRGLDLLLARKSQEAPEWTFEEVWGTLKPFVQHLEAYVYTAPATAKTWTNFFGKEGRPENPKDVPEYMISKLNDLICGDLEKEVLKKSSPEAQAKAMENLLKYRKSAFDLIQQDPSPWNIVNTENFSCYVEEKKEVPTKN